MTKYPKMEETQQNINEGQKSPHTATKHSSPRLN